jgi:hypothetical protein
MASGRVDRASEACDIACFYTPVWRSSWRAGLNRYFDGLDRLEKLLDLVKDR